MNQNLDDLLSANDYSEIICNGYKDIWCESRGQLKPHPTPFASELEFEKFIHTLCGEAAIHTDLKSPTTDGQWRDFRVHLVQKPIVPVNFHLSLRRHPKSPWTIEKLLENSWASVKACDDLRQIVLDQSNLLIVGPTGAGKTSTLNACLQAIAPNERAVIIEDTDEIRCPNSASIKLHTRFDQNGLLRDYALSDLVRQALRMRPDRIVMGEVRGPEAKDLLLALSTGHKGSLGTLHANDARQALIRLEMLIQLGAPDWSVESIRQLIKLSVDAIVVVGLESGQRILKGVYKITALDKVGFLLDY